MSGSENLRDEERAEKRYQAFWYHVRGVQIKEIAEKMGVTTRTVNRWINEQYRVNREELEAEGGRPDPTEEFVNAQMAVINACWEKLDKIETQSKAGLGSTNVTGLLNTISQALERIAKVRGLMLPKPSDSEVNVNLNLDFMREALDRAKREKKGGK